jgi:molybdate transport system substrate-binding protein
VKRVAAAGLGLALLTACSTSNAQADHSGSAAAGITDLTVFAASSLTGAFITIGKDFEAANPDVHVVFNFGPSDGLAHTIESERGADVFAAASPTWMDEVSAKVGVTQRHDFAQNRLVVITPVSDPGAITTLHDLATPGVQLVLAAPGVPVGDYARQVLHDAGIAGAAEANVVSNEQDDAALVTKVTSGEADAAVVYASDVTDQIAPLVRVIQIPDPENVIATYPIAVVTGGSNPAIAMAFVDYVDGQGQATMKAFGFLPPPSP